MSFLSSSNILLDLISLINEVNLLISVLIALNPLAVELFWVESEAVKVLTDSIKLEIDCFSKVYLLSLVPSFKTI